jgi:hypothetical protein
MNNLSICHRCDFRQRPCGGPCPCLAGNEPVDIMIRAESGCCPKGFFNAPRCEKCWGPHETKKCPIPDDYDGKDYKKGGCGCDGSQTTTSPEQTS